MRPSGPSLLPLAAVTGAVRPLAPSDSTDSAPAFSPDGRFVALTSTRDGGWTLHRVEVATGVVIRLTTGLEVWAQASWSADGSRLLFSARRQGVEEVCVANRAGTGLTRLTRGTGGIR